MNRSIFKKPFIFLMGLFIGGAALALVQKKAVSQRFPPSLTLEGATRMEEKGGLDVFGDFFGDEFFETKEPPFEEMRNMNKRMDWIFQEALNSSKVPDIFDERFGEFFGGSTLEIQRDEDEKFIYYNIGLKGQNKKNLHVDIKDGEITIELKRKYLKKNSLKGGNEVRNVHQEFKRTIPLPLGVDEKGVTLKPIDDGLIISFPKVKGRQPTN